MILIPRASTDTDRAHHVAIALQRNSAGENHDLAVIGSVNSEELPAGLGVRRQILGCYIKGAGSERLVDRNIDAADPGAIHAHVSDKVSAAIGYGDVHGLSDFFGF